MYFLFFEEQSVPKADVSGARPKSFLTHIES